MIGSPVYSSRTRRAVDLLRELNWCRREHGHCHDVTQVFEERLRAFDERRRFQQPKGQGLLYVGGKPRSVIYDIRYSADRPWREPEA